MERMQRVSDDLAELEKARLLCQVYFGAGSEKPFDTIFIARNKIISSARMLIRTAGSQRTSLDDTQRWESDIWEGSTVQPAEDEIAKSVARAVIEIETLCRKHLKP
jgi:hypothetical protein